MNLAVAVLRDKLLGLQHLGSMNALLSWDQQVNVPAKGYEARAQLMAHVSGLYHRDFTSSEFETVLMQAQEAMDRGELNEDESCIVRETLCDFVKSKKLPNEFVDELSLTCARAHDFWARARKNSDFGLFAPHLEKIVELKRQEAELVNPSDSWYDVLLDDFEPGLTSDKAEKTFTELKKFLVPFVSKIANSSVKTDRSFLKGPWDIGKQKKFAKMVLTRIGFDLDAGHMGTSLHPFCQELHPSDVRITVRYKKDDFVEQCLMSAIHESGHGMYEQGLPVEYFGTPRGEAVSLGIHEFNSRLWENYIGRSHLFWEYFFPELKLYFSEVLAGVSLESFYKAINCVRPSLIRVDADEVTYNLHVIFRFEIEKDLIGGHLTVNDLPRAWNQKVADYFGIEVDKDANGVLQDIHWSEGSFGYFPTYVLGNLYAAQFCNAAMADLPEKILPEEFFNLLLGWLRTNVHSKGKLYSAAELVKRVTGQELSVSYFQEYLQTKYSGIYGV